MSESEAIFGKPCAQEEACQSPHPPTSSVSTACTTYFMMYTCIEFLDQVSTWCINTACSDDPHKKKNSTEKVLSIYLVELSGN